MRPLTFLALVALMSVSLSGCLGFGDDESTDDHGDHGEHDHCDPTDAANFTADECPDVAPPAQNETEEPQVPNQLPSAVLNMTGPDGPLNKTSYVLPGANVTFSAAASSDPDGQIALVGLTVSDSNGTRTAQLFRDGAFVNATFTFTSVGPVNVTIRVLDDEGEGVIRVGSFAVNDLIVKEEDFSAAAPTGSADACDAPGGSSTPPLVTNNFAARSTFSVQRGAQWIEAKVTGGSAQIAICSPDGEPLSGAGTEVATEDDGNSTLPVNAQYYVMVLSKGSAGGEVTIDVLVHYEPKA